MKRRTLAGVLMGIGLVVLLVRAGTEDPGRGPSEAKSPREAEAEWSGGSGEGALRPASAAARARGIGATNFLPEDWAPPAPRDTARDLSWEQRRLARGMASGARRRLGNGTIVFDGEK